MHSLSAAHTAALAAAEAPSARTEPTAVAGAPRIMLRAEGALVLAAGLLAYRHLGHGWGWFAALFLAPDLSMLGYLAGARVGAATYNAAHWYGAPALLALAGLALGAPALYAGAAIWLAHVGFDRAMGYGLKYSTAFGHTHLGRVGRG